LDAVFLHRWLGLPLFFVIMYVLFQVIFWVGAPVQDAIAWSLVQFRHMGLESITSILPAFLQGLLLDGIYDGVGTVASFVPIIILFFLCMTFVEDSGYLSRAAFLMDMFMAKVGLDGRSFVMILMGFGCNVPALMGTRIIGSRGLRLLSMLVIPFSLCSARLQVFIFFIAALFSQQVAPLVLFSFYLLSFGIVFLSAWVFKGQYLSTEPFVLEMPPYRLPTPQQILLRAWHEVRHFLNRASKFIIIGVVLVWLLTHIPYDVPPASAQTLAGIIGQWLSPLFAPLGIDPPLIITLIFGFVAKEIVIGSLAVIYGVEDNALTHVIMQHVDWVQAYSFMLFTLVYTPCLSTLTTLFNESKSLSFSIINLIYPLVLAWLMSFAFYQTARWLGF
jgi:ferrous iron transport protein B